MNKYDELHHQLLEDLEALQYVYIKEVEKLQSECDHPDWEERDDVLETEDGEVFTDMFCTVCAALKPEEQSEIILPGLPH